MESNGEAVCIQSCAMLSATPFNETSDTHKNMCVKECESGYYEMSTIRAQQKNCISIDECGEGKVKLKISAAVFECRTECPPQMPYLDKVTLENKPEVQNVCVAKCPFGVYEIRNS